MKAQIPWLRILVEAVAIVGSILLAFGIQAWWDGRGELGEERAALELLLSDFRSNSARLDTIIVEDEETLRARYELLRISSTTDAGVSADSMAVLVINFQDVWTYDPVLGGLNSVIASGQLKSIRNDSLASSLAAWPDAVENLYEGELLNQDINLLHLQPYLQRSNYWKPILLGTDRLPGAPTAPVPDRLLNITEDDYFMNMVAHRIYLVEYLLKETETVDNGVETIIRLIEVELADR